mmetsp:Transcript_2451/g.6977  ORF Transcript_2451/g.6977 Transcript_2451/m.6977 type:complete len:225 (-) Transcript_2451:1027-1701(-)
MPASKHSQYFLRHLLFLQWQPDAWAVSLTFALNAFGFFSSVARMASSRSLACARSLWQSTQLQPLHQRPAAKQSQYNLRHLELRQLQGLWRLTLLSGVSSSYTGLGALLAAGLLVGGVVPCANRFLGGGGPVALRFRGASSAAEKALRLLVTRNWTFVGSGAWSFSTRCKTSSSDMAVFTAWAAASVSSSGGGDRLGEFTSLLGEPSLPSSEMPTSFVGGGLCG